MRRAEIRRRFDQIVEFSEIGRFLDTPVKHYSSGMRVRLGFAVAAHLELDVLLVDEVLAVGDLSFQRKCLGKMGDVVAEGRTVVFVSHNMTAINQLCSRAVLISDGQVALDGVPADVIARYLDQSVESQGQRNWPNPMEAPGNDRVRLSAVTVRSKGVAGATIDIDQETCIDVDFVLLQPGSRMLAVVIYLLDSSGATVLSTVNAPHATLVPDGWFGADHDPGRYRATCVLPANFLNDIRYYVSVYLVTHDTVTIEATAEQTVAFDVFDTGAMRDNSSEWHGVVRPRLGWETRALYVTR
jgi:lipopolysaccharide transport system ATP-binding protein